MTTVQGELAPLFISEDSGETWKTLVCLETYKVPLDTTVNEEETNCGVAVGLGAIKFKPSGTAVMEAEPDDNCWATVFAVLAALGNEWIASDADGKPEHMVQRTRCRDEQWSAVDRCAAGSV